MCCATLSGRNWGTQQMSISMMTARTQGSAFFAPCGCRWCGDICEPPASGM